MSAVSLHAGNGGIAAVAAHAAAATTAAAAAPPLRRQSVRSHLVAGVHEGQFVEWRVQKRMQGSASRCCGRCGR